MIDFHFCVSWWLLVRTALQHHCQTLRLGHGLLGSRNHLSHHYSCVHPDAQHQDQNGTGSQEGRLDIASCTSAFTAAKVEIHSECFNSRGSLGKFHKMWDPFYRYIRELDMPDISVQ